MAYDPGEVTPEDLLASIRELDFEPEVIEPVRETKRAVDHIDPAVLQDELAQVFARSRDSGKAVLLRFSGPG